MLPVVDGLRVGYSRGQWRWFDQMNLQIWNNEVLALGIVDGLWVGKWVMTVPSDVLIRTVPSDVWVMTRDRRLQIAQYSV